VGNSKQKKQPAETLESVMRTLVGDSNWLRLWAANGIYFFIYIFFYFSKVLYSGFI
jgi:hypothetical protein